MLLWRADATHPWRSTTLIAHPQLAAAVVAAIDRLGLFQHRPQQTDADHEKPGFLVIGIRLLWPMLKQPQPIDRSDDGGS